MLVFVQKTGIVFNSVKMFRSIGLSVLWATFSQNSLPLCAENRKRYFTVEIYLWFFCLFVQSEKLKLKQ